MAARRLRVRAGAGRAGGGGVGGGTGEGRGGGCGCARGRWGGGGGVGGGPPAALDPASRVRRERAFFRGGGGRFLPLVVFGPALSGRATAVIAAAASRR